MKVVDADAHVEENTTMWEFLDPEFRGRRPLPLCFPENVLDAPYDRFNAVWLIEGKVFPKLHGPGFHIFATPPMSVQAHSKKVSLGAQDMTDVASRLRDMDGQGIAYQVVYPTLFLVSLAEDHRLERALCQAYNRFLSEACKKSDNRVFFAGVVPTQRAADAIEVAREAKALGAVAVMVPGLFWDRPMSDPEFMPFYQELETLDLPLAVHVAWGSPTLNRIFSTPQEGNFGSFVLPLLMGFWSLMVSGVYDRCPGLRVVFLEGGCEWIPYVLKQLERRYDSSLSHLERRPSEYLRDGNLYFTCEADEDLKQVLQFVSEDRLMIASDYPHVDPSTEEDMIRALEQHQAGLSAGTREKILASNPVRFYKLPV